MDEQIRLDAAGFPNEVARGGEEVGAAERFESGIGTRHE
jgi:hypothetical protein